MEMIDQFRELASVSKTLEAEQKDFLREILQLLGDLFAEEEDEERCRRLELIKLTLEDPDKVLDICNYLDLVCMPRN
ncbi:MAG: hypothetical protein HYY20_03995 [Candidatus Tectomicrobia bacterium]|uniref:Uncharacterized protein n=1 Tax=Tectimicrobiota bacterium TaxID=2528274 RepID=A0A932CN56_UNCTE|nr:hypothetical protein [Candidatus Tectomicrobia bacterium]